jgi:hypothetical protein
MGWVSSKYSVVRSNFDLDLERRTRRSWLAGVWYEVEWHDMGWVSSKYSVVRSK